MNNWDYVREVSALRAPEHLRGKIAGLPAQSCGGRRPRRAIPAKWHSIAAALVLVAGLGIAAPAILRAFTTGGEITPPPVATGLPTETPGPGTPAISDEELTKLLAAYIPQAPDDAAPELLYSARRGGRTLGVLRYYTDSPEGGTMSLILGLFDNETKAIADGFINVIPGCGGEVCAWEGEDGLLYLLYTNYTVPEGIEKYVAGLYAMYENGSVLASELPDNIISQPNVPSEAIEMFHWKAGPSGFWDNHLASIVLNGLELYVRTPGWSDSSQDMAQWTYLGFIPLPLTFSSLYINLQPQEIQGVAIDKLDYAKLKDQMDPGDWAALQEYRPVLREGMRFLWVAQEGVNGGGGEDVTLEEYYEQCFAPSQPDGVLDLERLTLFGFEGNGKQDLVLCFFNGGGHYLILHREGEKFYGFERSYRSFQGLQRDGVYIGSSGANYSSFYRIQFHAGYYEEQLLGQCIGERHEIGGQAVSAEYFWTWQQNCMVGDMYWYYPAQPTGKAPPPSTPEERRYHISIQGLPLEEDFSQLPEGLLATLEDTGEIDSLGSGSPFIMKTYRSPSLEVQTLMAPPEMLEELLAEGTFTQEQYDAALGTEYIYTARALDRSYPTGSGLRLGDSAERARELFYNVPDDGRTVMNAVLASLIVTTENGVVTGLLSSSGGRTVAGILY